MIKKGGLRADINLTPTKNGITHISIASRILQNWDGTIPYIVLLVQKCTQVRFGVYDSYANDVV